MLAVRMMGFLLGVIWNGQTGSVVHHLADGVAGVLGGPLGKVPGTWARHTQMLIRNFLAS